MDGVRHEQVAVRVDDVPQVREVAHARRDGAWAGVEHLLPVADASPGPLGARGEPSAQVEDRGRVAGAPLDLATERLAEVDPEADVAAEPGREAGQVRADGELPARVVVVQGVVAQHGGGERLRVAGRVQQAGRGGRRRIDRRVEVVHPAVGAEAPRHVPGTEPAQAPRADRRHPRVDPVAGCVDDRRDRGGERAAVEHRGVAAGQLADGLADVDELADYRRRVAVRGELLVEPVQGVLRQVGHPPAHRGVVGQLPRVVERGQVLVGPGLPALAEPGYLGLGEQQRVPDQPREQRRPVLLLVPVEGELLPVHAQVLLEQVAQAAVAAHRRLHVAERLVAARRRGLDGERGRGYRLPRREGVRGADPVEDRVQQGHDLERQQRAGTELAARGHPPEDIEQRLGVRAHRGPAVDRCGCPRRCDLAEQGGDALLPHRVARTGPPGREVDGGEHSVRHVADPQCGPRAERGEDPGRPVAHLVDLGRVLHVLEPALPQHRPERGDQVRDDVEQCGVDHPDAVQA